MTLFTAVLGTPEAGGDSWPTPWGSCGVHPAEDPTALALSQAVQDPDTTHVLVLSPPATAAAAAVSASTIAAVRSDLAVVVESRPMSVCAFVRAVEVSSERAASPNEVRATVLAALDSMVWGAWMPGVGKLESPAPTLLQHLSSVFARGQGFMAVKGQPGWVDSLPVEPLEPSRRLTRMAPADPAADYEAHAYGELPEVAIKTLFAMGLKTRPRSRPATNDPRAAWGTPKAIEFVITHPAAIRLGPPAGYCRVCDDPVWAGHCSFCHSAISPTPQAAHTTRSDLT